MPSLRSFGVARKRRSPTSEAAVRIPLAHRRTRPTDHSPPAPTDLSLQLHEDMGRCSRRMKPYVGQAVLATRGPQNEDAYVAGAARHLPHRARDRGSVAKLPRVVRSLRDFAAPRSVQADPA